MQGRWILTLTAAVAALASFDVTPANAQGRGDPRFSQSPRTRAYTYTFGARSHTARLAEEMRRQANSICVELDRNYRNNPRYREIYRDAYQLITDAKHIQQLIGDGYMRGPRGKEDHIEDDLHDMDRLFHEVERDLRRWQPDRRQPGRQDRNDLDWRLNELQETLHHLMDDYGTRSRFDNDRGRDNDRRDNDRDRDRDRRR